MNYIDEYKSKIDAGEIAAGKWIKLLFEKVDECLQSGIFLFDEEKAERAIKFIETFCHHCKGRNDLIHLELWQKAVISLIFGITDKSGNRNFREVFIVTGRKSGKSLLASAIMAYMAFMDGEYGAEIYCLAPKLEQAAIVYDAFYQMLKAEPELSELAQKRRSDIYLQEANTTIKPLAFNAKKSDGFNPHLVVCDEIASWAAEQGLKQYEVMKSALGARKQPLIISISTAGYINDGIYDELMKRSTAWLLGNSEENRLLSILFIVDDGKKWNDFGELEKSNPNIDVSVSRDFFREEIAVAKGSLSKLAEFKTKYCNIKQNSTAAWLPYEIINKCCIKGKTLDSFKQHYCVGGVDLSQTTDLTSAAVIIEDKHKLYTFAHFWMPQNKIAELQKSEGVPYSIYIAQGLLSPSGENYIDYNDVFMWFRMLVEQYEILPLQVGYDRYSSQYLIQQMTSYGFHMDDVFQGENLSPVIQECEGLLRDETLLICDNNLLKSHLLNAGLKQSAETRKSRLIKIEQRCHIDGAVAVLDALTVRQKWYEQIGHQLRNE